MGNELSYLRRGSERQRKAFSALLALDLFATLAEFEPVLAGSIPLGVETHNSDLDVLCFARDLNRFGERATTAYRDQAGFEIRYEERNPVRTIICSFRLDDMTIELFAQPIPPREQVAYRHLMAEARLLHEAGERGITAIRALKEAGLKTEPAFAEYFRLPGDPYEAVMSLADAPIEKLRQVVIGAIRHAPGPIVNRNPEP